MVGQRSHGPSCVLGGGCSNPFPSGSGGMSPAYEIITAGLLRFVRKPVEIIPDTDGLCFIEDLSSGRRTHHGVGKFVDGEWQDAHGQALKWSPTHWRSEEHTSELQSLMRISYAVFCLKK